MSDVFGRFRRASMTLVDALGRFRRTDCRDVMFSALWKSYMRRLTLEFNIWIFLRQSVRVIFFKQSLIFLRKSVRVISCQGVVSPDKLGLEVAAAVGDRLLLLQLHARAGGERGPVQLSAYTGYKGLTRADTQIPDPPMGKPPQTCVFPTSRLRAFRYFPPPVRLSKARLRRAKRAAREAKRSELQ